MGGGVGVCVESIIRLISAKAEALLGLAELVLKNILSYQILIFPF